MNPVFRKSRHRYGYIVIFECDTCGKRTKRAKANYDTKHNYHYCSTKCWGIGKSTQFAIICTCAACGKEIKRSKWTHDRNKYNYCSRKCTGLHRRIGYVNSWGYRLITVDTPSGPKIVLEHRWVMERMLGRKLRKGETVHHGPGGRADNSEENLFLRAPSKHPRGWSPQEMKQYLSTIPKKLGGLGPNLKKNKSQKKAHQ